MNKAQKLSKYSRLMIYYRKNGLWKTGLRLIEKTKEKFFSQFIPPWSFIERPVIHIRILCRALSKKCRLPVANKEMKKILNLKGRHEGQRCFVACTGPSLTQDDLEKLNDEITFSMNSIILAYGQTEWRPTYYVAVDHYSQGKMLRSQEVPGERYSIREAFFSSLIKPKYKLADNCFCLINCINHTRKRMKNGIVTVSQFPEVCINDCFTVTNMAIQLAVYMGFKDIYLIGADCNYNQEKMHFIETDFDRQTKGAAWYPEAVRLNMVGYCALKNYALQHDCQIFNATRGGMLEVFPRVNLDEVI